MNPTNKWIDKKSISVEKAEYIKKLEDKRNRSINSYEKVMYSKMIKEETDGICSHCHRSYNLVDFKKQMEKDRDNFIK